eukprot:15419-Heterococcus_DN1.PRE.2
MQLALNNQYADAATNAPALQLPVKHWQYGRQQVVLVARMYGTMTAALGVIAVAQLYVAVSPDHHITVHDSAVAALLMA